ncbi:hypothetical protein SLV14_003636 [Streptomyces sp. Je 1-4]|uniref:hypothetical protein n=1 Tax=Streptomyces TaxID=1883 RepID=UPI0021D88853|nr:MULTISPECIES: hypothetical protein [unclassified Streptomyces]UYB40956.1 hypothetical protein SLV14_003636 [Streptomyces sp. Je 1-4]UZQ37117.1 hypothetical protein SLV14N_003636 [Streptomyces sp. Je 1-4] [Streptomyces sp. Je 1-4 4N24]UZQ44534.1 hypothetical protein SLV14NA_003636 [Streptomyces sp. Je 1-4] [Streptomyces sp. Je 1-4 4N24_ara]
MRIRAQVPTAVRAVVWGLVGLALGGLVGFEVHAISQQGAQNQFMAVGMAVGAALAVAAAFYRNAFRVESLQLWSGPGSTVTIRFDGDKRLLAAKLFHEAADRIIAQPLDDGRGSICAASDSLYAWITFRREQTRPAGPAKAGLEGIDTVDHYASDLLNKVIRPFTTKWHYELTWYAQHHPEQHEALWPFNDEFRYDLKVLQYQARPYLEGLAKVAGVSNPQAFLGPPPSRPAPLPDTHVPWHENPARIAPPGTSPREVTGQQPGTVPRPATTSPESGTEN